MKSENIQASVAIAIALFALFISVWQGCEQRRHNRLSVKPILTFDEISHNDTKSIHLSNDGLGPALISKFLIKEKEKSFDAKDGNPWRSISLFSDLPYSQMYYFNKGATIKPNENYILFSWQADTIRNLDIEVLIEYHSIYEEEFEMISDF